MSKFDDPRIPQSLREEWLAKIQELKARYPDEILLHKSHLIEIVGGAPHSQVIITELDPMKQQLLEALRQPAHVPLTREQEAQLRTYVTGFELEYQTGSGGDLEPVSAETFCPVCRNVINAKRQVVHHTPECWIGRWLQST